MIIQAHGVRRAAEFWTCVICVATALYLIQLLSVRVVPYTLGRDGTAFGVCATGLVASVLALRLRRCGVGDAVWRIVAVGLLLLHVSTAIPLSAVHSRTTWQTSHLSFAILLLAAGIVGLVALCVRASMCKTRAIGSIGLWGWCAVFVCVGAIGTLGVSSPSDAVNSNPLIECCEGALIGRRNTQRCPKNSGETGRDLNGFSAWLANGTRSAEGNCVIARRFDHDIWVRIEFKNATHTEIRWVRYDLKRRMGTPLNLEHAMARVSMPQPWLLGVAGLVFFCVLKNARRHLKRPGTYFEFLKFFALCCGAPLLAVCVRWLAVVVIEVCEVRIPPTYEVWLWW